MKALILGIGKTDESYIQTGCDIYLKRLKHYVKTNTHFIPDLKKIANISSDERCKREGDLLLKQIEPTDLVILLDEKGKDYTSRKFSQFFQKQMNTGAKRIVFVIGGAFGFSDDMYNRANQQLSISKMTFSHQMIRLFLLEQIYRACTILNNEPYHND